MAVRTTHSGAPASSARSQVNERIDDFKAIYSTGHRFGHKSIVFYEEMIDLRPSRDTDITRISNDAREPIQMRHDYYETISLSSIS